MTRSNKDRTEATRTALLDAARALFVDRGYAATATPDIVAAAGVTRGALYHHFEDKRALFLAVVEREASTVAAEIEARAAPETDARKALILGARGYFDAMSQKGRTRLLLLDAPAVLGSERAAALDRRNAEASLRAGLSNLLRDEAGRLLDQMTALLSAGFDRAAVEIAEGGDRAAYEAAIVCMIDGLCPR
ncbi:TetR family transcriptional regulator [Rhizobium sp. GN54]|uniref:TetR family transcriptional regulator n=1 Tax=Rhizobium sp. GN54 TaxID=2898150 RepID=UPI001E2FB87E|nr:TetR family transcriptional regulator [Rhizobium sp. GN54]MCD2184084.1 TetR family transcriptional regulator [Rhizobium sp. GN54]